MVRLLTTILLLAVFSTSTLAKEVDLHKSKGIDQDAIVSLHPSPAQVEVAKDITLKVVLNVDLDIKHVKKHDIKLKQLHKKKNIKGEVSYLADKNTVTFEPDKDLEMGFYEVEVKSLKAVKEEKEKKIKEIKYRFYVPEVVNGYMLPPEVDPDINNATLLGIDFNGNGVRDDVERYVIKRFAQDIEYPKTKTAIAMQYAWASQKIIEAPVVDNKKFTSDAISCKFYWIEKTTKDMPTLEAMQFIDKHKIYDSELYDVIYNSRTRIERKFEYNSALSGNIFKGQENTLDRCHININEIGE